VKRDDASTSARLTHAIGLAAPDLLRYLERRLSREDAADALAEVMMTAWRRVDSLPRDDEDARMWLFGIGRNVVANSARGERRRWSLAERFRDVLRAAPTEGLPADEGIEVRDAIARLSADQAELVRLIHWDGFTIAEAARITGTHASTARTRYQAARTALRTALSTVPESGAQPSASTAKA
jgi:RNA polymerase sigma factor (sigma-70 family)